MLEKGTDLFEDPRDLASNGVDILQFLGSIGLVRLVPVDLPFC